jgi:hypothetical protein
MAKPKNPDLKTPRIVLNYEEKQVPLNASTLTSVFKYYGEPKPDSFSQANLRALFLHNKIRLTGPSEVNDPFDCNPHYVSDVSGAKAIRSMLDRPPSTPTFAAYQSRVKANFPTRKSRRRNRSFQNFVKEMTESATREHYQNQGFSSFTTLKNHPLMWAHYGSSHRGLMVEFRTRPEKNRGDICELPIGSQLMQVRYTNQRPVIKESDFVRGMKTGSWPHSIIDAVLNRPRHWEYEDEWRYIGRLESERIEPVRGESHDIGDNAILSVTIGAAASAETLEFAKFLASEKPDLKLYKNEISDRQFSFRTSPVGIS